MSLGGLSVFLLILVAIVLALLGARLLTAAYRRNDKGRGGGADDGSGDESTEKRLQKEGEALRREALRSFAR